MIPIEIKSAVTPDGAAANPMRKVPEISRGSRAATVAPGFIIYGGDELRPLGEDRFVPWHGIAEALAGIP